MEVVIISVAPVALLAAYIWFRDKYEREPLKLLLLALFAGILIVWPVVAVESLLSAFGDPLEGMAGAAWTAFAVAGFTEELFKFLALLLLIWRRRDFNDKYDGIVYGTFLSLGFAGVENIMYVFREGVATGLVRAFTAVPAHAIFGITMGYYLGFARFYPGKKALNMANAFFIPFGLHGLYDFILMTGIEWLWIVFLVFLIFLYISGLRKMKHFSDQSYFRTDFNLLNRKFEKHDENT